jgi:hypothetical protein
MKRRIRETLGYISTLLLCAMALLPQIFHISPTIHPWVFLGAIMWFFLFITGYFNQ